jgi:hypothetical protein
LEVTVFKTLGLSLIMGLLVCSHTVFGQIAPSGQQRIPQSIIINGQQVQGVMVVQNETVQTFTCQYPQQYVTVDQSSSGWACFEQATGVWLLHAQPPQQTTTTQQAPTIVYSQPTPVYVPAPTVSIYSYPYSYYYGDPYYSYYPYYGSPYVFGPGFGIGFGFRSAFFVNRPVVINRPFVGRPFISGPVGTFAASRPSGGFRSGGGREVGRVGRR